LKSAEVLNGIEAANAGDDLIKAIDGLPDSIGFKEAQELRSRLISKVDEFSVINKNAPAIGKAKKLIGLVDSEIEKGLPSDALDAWRDANQFYRESMDQFQPIMIRKLMKYAEETGVGSESIGRALFKPGNLTMIKKAKGALSPDEWEKAQSFYIQRAFKEASDLKTGELNGTKLMNNLFNKASGMGDETLREIFAPEQLKAIRDMGTTLKLIQEHNPDKTGRMLIQLAQGGALATLGGGAVFDTSDSVKGSAAAILFGPMIVSRMLVNPSITRWLTKGLQMSPESPEVFGLLSRLVGAAHRIKLDMKPTEEFNPPESL